MKGASSLGGALFVLGLLLFLYGAFNQAAVNSATGLGRTGMAYTTYLAMMNEFRALQFGGGVVAVLGAALACSRKD
jgi:hypothetical protein